MIMTRLCAIAALSFALMASTAGAAEKLKAIASFSILGDMVEQVAGEDAEVTTFVGPDGDAHTFEPTPAEGRGVAEADVIFVNGLGLDGWMERLTEAAHYKGPVVVASKGIVTRAMVEEEGGSAETVIDPHAWQDLRNGAVYVGNIVSALSKADPANAAGYESRGKAYIEVLKALDAEVRAKIAAVPENKRRVITSHDAFGYFGAAYGVEFLAPEGISTESEASAGDIVKLVNQIRQEGIKALFVENVTDPRLVEMIGKETGVELGGALFSDALSPPDGPAPHYVDMFGNNIAKLAAGMAKNEVPGQ